MAEFDIQTEQWMSQSAFEALDKSTIPEGTEINIVGDIVESDLSVDLQNKINAGGAVHQYRMALSYTSDINSSDVVYILFYSEKDNLTVADIPNLFPIDFMSTYPVAGWGSSGNVFGCVMFGSFSLSGTTLTAEYYPTTVTVLNDGTLQVSTKNSSKTSTIELTKIY